MTLSLVAPTSATVSFLECGPVAIWRSCSPRGTPSAPTHRVIRFLLDYIAGSFLVAGATEVLVPTGMVHWMERNTVGKQQSRWKALSRDHRLVVLASCDEVESVLGHYPSYHNFCLPVPSGPLSSELLFGHPIEAYYGVLLKRVMGLFKGKEALPHVTWRAWMRSGLTCRFEGQFVPPIRVSEYATFLLGTEGGCTQIILEEGYPALTPRWLETSLKTALSCGIPASCVAMAFCDATHVPKLIDKGVEVGVRHFCTSSLGRQFALFEKSHALVPIHTASSVVSHLSECSGLNLSDAELEQLDNSATFVETARTQWCEEAGIKMSK